MNIQAFRTSGTGTNGIVKIISSGLVVASMLGASATSNAYPTQITIERTSATPNNVGNLPGSSENTSSTARGIMAIRQIANLTWDETAKVFGVTRRTVHLWANGRHPSGDQERKLNRVLGILRSYRNIGPLMLREKLMTSAKPGILFFDLLSNDEFDTFQELFLAENEPRKYSPPSLSPEVTSYSPQPPILLLDALQDRPISAGKAISKKSIRLNRQSS
jgi:DNA-binding transcriptional regulator YiaG